jgi:hypothetical protein
MSIARAQHTATRLTNGEVLVVGGDASAEVYNPATGTWSPTGSMAIPRTRHSASLLTDGRVLVAGGLTVDPLSGYAVDTSTSELYNPTTGTWAAAGSMTSTRDHHTATLLATGQVLIAGGDGGGGAGAELYDATTGWSTTASMTSARYGGHTATLLPSGQVVVAGGSVVTGNAASAEVYTSGTSTPPAPTDTVTVKLAQYDTAKHVLSVEATSTSATTTLTVAVTSTGQTIGTLTNSGGGTYKAQFNWPTNPLSITIKSSLGGASTATVTAK